jgi:hypothetical protein
VESSIGRAYKPWIIVSVAVLVGSLMLLAAVGTIGFVYYANSGMPVWLLVLGVVAALGVALGFGGFFLLMLAAGWKSFREARRVQVIPPEHPAEK